MRSDSLVADAKRRDFTINCLYYTVVGKGGSGVKSSLIILQDHDLIEKFFVKGIFQEEAFDIWAKENNHKKEKVIRFLIDPFKGLQDLEK